jgi:nucleotide-binding universal stress UspA family protein
MRAIRPAALRAQRRPTPTTDGGSVMQRVVVAAKAGADEPWLADAAAQLARQTGAKVDVVSVDGLELEALSTVPRSELAALARDAADRMVAHLAEAGVEATSAVRQGRVARGILLFAEEREADMIVCGASGRGPVATRVLGNVPLDLVQRSRRPVLVITPPHREEAAHGRAG